MRRFWAMTRARLTEVLRDRTALLWQIGFVPLLVVGMAVMLSGAPQPVFTVGVIGDLPLFGRFFQSHSKQTQKDNLMIFVTATIVDPAGNRVHSDDELPFNPVTIPVQPAVEGQAFQPNAAATGAVAPPPPPAK